MRKIAAFFSYIFFSNNVLSATPALVYDDHDLLRDCKNGYEICWPVISSVIASGQLYVAERQGVDISYCMPWDITYSYGTFNNPYGGETNPWIRDTIIGKVTLYIEEKYKHGETYQHVQPAAMSVIYALHNAYSCDASSAKSNKSQSKSETTNKHNKHAGK